MQIETKCIHEGYAPGNGQPRALPIYQSTTYNYESSEYIGGLFDLSVEGHMYSRLSNPTVVEVEKKIAALEGGVGAICTTSGQAASLVSLLNILESGDHFISSGSIYGGTVNLFAFTLKKLGIDCSFVDASLPLSQLQEYVRPNTKAVFGETLANPALAVLDLEKMADFAHRNNVPLIIDNTFPTPILCRPLEYGADIVVHSTTKYMDGHGVVVGGVIVDGGNFDWEKANFSGLTQPDQSYHGLIYTQAFGRQAYIVKARAQYIRDFGVYPAAHSAFLLNLGLETLAVRMQRHCENALAVAHFLNSQEKIETVAYPGLKTDKYYSLAQKYLPKGASGVISFTVKGGRDRAVKFIDSLKLVSNAVHVADLKTCILHPGSSTHRQLTDEQMLVAGINPGTVRLSVGLENVDDIIADLTEALSVI